MKKILTYRGMAMPWECDSNRHLNVMYYVNKFEQAGRNFMHEMGLHELSTNPEMGVVALEQKINYFQEVHADDLLKIHSSLLDIDTKAFTVLHEMYNIRTAEVISTMKIVFVLFDRMNRCALPFPPERRETLLQQL